MEILFIYSDLQQAPSWGCRSWYPKACLAAWRWGFYPSLPTNLLFTLGLLLFLSELKFPICETNVTSHRFGNRSQKGWAGFKGTHQPWFVKWISKCAGPSAVWTPDVVLAGEGFEKFHYLSTYSFFFFCYPTSIWCLSMYWLQDFLSEATGETKSHSQLDLLQIY